MTKYELKRMIHRILEISGQMHNDAMFCEEFSTDIEDFDDDEFEPFITRLAELHAVMC